jgi:hypothetical protein
MISLKLILNKPSKCDLKSIVSKQGPLACNDLRTECFGFVKATLSLTD